MLAWLLDRFAELAKVEPSWASMHDVEIGDIDFDDPDVRQAFAPLGDG